VGLKGQEERSTLSSEKEEKRQEFLDEFTNALADDLNTSKALAVVWEAVKSNIPANDKYDLVMSFDEVLGLKLNKEEEEIEIPEEVINLAEKREEARKEGNWKEADSLRDQIEKMDFLLSDTPEGFKIIKK
jgi:cysteinyl-tRNA synthetase